MPTCLRLRYGSVLSTFSTAELSALKSLFIGSELSKKQFTAKPVFCGEI